MLASVDLDNQMGLQAGEIGNKRTHGDLASEAMAGDLLSAEPYPQTGFSIGRLRAEPAGALNFRGRSVGHTDHLQCTLRAQRREPPPRPSPKGGGRTVCPTPRA